MTAREEIRAALEGNTTLTRMELVAACKSQPSNIDVTCKSMIARGEMIRGGEKGCYTYTLNHDYNKPARTGRTAPVRRSATNRTPPATKRVVTASPERDFIFALDADKRFLALMPDGNHILFNEEQTLKIADLMLTNFTAD